jgi:PadR family transcriptional regulator PadR
LREVGDASVYGTLRRLEDAGHVRSRMVPSDAGPPRKYLALTVTGRDVLRRGLNEWAEVDGALSALTGGRAKAVG